MDSLLASTDVEESYSFAYVHAVATSAGYVVAEPRLDRNGIDLTIESGGHMRPKIDVQLKATVNLSFSDNIIKYSCRQRNYDLLREQTQTPRILIVMHLPREEDKWITISNDQLVIKNCAYWMCLHGYPDSGNTTATTIDIPIDNIFNTESIIMLMQKSRTGSLK